MIEITKGNPTSEEIAALVAVLMLVGGARQSRPTGSTSGQWRRADAVRPSQSGCAEPMCPVLGSLACRVVSR